MLNTLIVVDDEKSLSNKHKSAISFEQYLSDYPKKSDRKARVINLSESRLLLFPAGGGASAQGFTECQHD
jgi:hypothetical protein